MWRSLPHTRIFRETEHVVMLPFMAQGHLRPFFHLAHRLHSQSPNPLRVSILTTPLNAHYLRHILPPPTATTTTTTTTTIEIVDLPFNSSDHGLPENIENTDKLPLPLIISLLHASTSLEPHLRQFLSRRHLQPPLCIIFDTFLGWANGVAKSVGSTGIAFTTCGAYGTAAYVSVWNHLPHRNYSDEEDFPLPGFPDNHRFSRSQLHRILRFADGCDDWSKFFQPQIRLSMESSAWLCNSIEEMEPVGFKILRNYIKMPVWAIGPLVPSTVERSSSSSSDECIQWLNSHKPDSVLYISFGSQNTISRTQMMELATGLEQCGKPFLWVIRPPYGFDINSDLQPEWLPEGFEGRMKESKQGILVHKWGPQLEVLSHESTGAFLSHCGWNSVLESLSRGVPMIGWPLAAEQAYNSKMLVEETGVAVELARGLEGKVGMEDVKKVVDLVLGREEGSHGWEMKKKAVEMGKRLKDALREDEECGCNKGSSINAMNEFLDAIVSRLFEVDKAAVRTSGTVVVDGD